MLPLGDINVKMQEESALQMEDLGIQDAKVSDRVIHKAKRPSKALLKVRQMIM